MSIAVLLLSLLFVCLEAFRAPPVPHFPTAARQQWRRAVSFPTVLNMADGGASTMELVLGKKHAEFISKYASIDVPKRLETLLKLTELLGEDEIIDPAEYRKGMNPFLIPLAKSKKDGSILAYIRWPTQKEDMDLQLVRTTETGLRLVAMASTSYCRRIVAEMDFYSRPNADEAIEIINKDSPLYEKGEFLGLLRSGKFPAITEEDLALILDRYLLTKVGPFPDCYERIAQNFLNKGDEVSALVTCERAVSIFYGWGHPLLYYSNMLRKCSDRDLEARDTARTTLGMPIWTIADKQAELEELALNAGFTGCQILGEMHAYRANDPREDDIGEGLSPIQVTLDQAAHYMDAMAFGNIDGGWEACKEIIASKYEEAGYPEMATFIKA